MSSKSTLWVNVNAICIIVTACILLFVLSLFTPDHAHSFEGMRKDISATTMKSAGKTMRFYDHGVDVFNASGWEPFGEQHYVAQGVLSDKRTIYLATSIISLEHVEAYRIRFKTYIQCPQDTDVKEEMEWYLNETIGFHLSCSGERSLIHNPIVQNLPDPVIKLIQEGIAW